MLRSPRTIFAALVLLSLQLGVLSQFTAPCFNPIDNVFPLLAIGPSTAQYTSCTSGADAPKISNLNQSSYEWWYFDVVSPSGSEAVTVVFSTSSYTGFSLNPASQIDPLNVVVGVTFPNGTTSLIPLFATSAMIKTVGDGASGHWLGSGALFTGTSDLSSYTVTVSNPLEGISGTISIKSVSSPFHFSLMLCPAYDTWLTSR
jgi:hypothetical protein